MCVPCHAIANKLIFHLSSNILGSAHSFALLIPPLKKHLYNAENAFNFDVYLHVKRITSIPNDHVEYSCVCVCVLIARMSLVQMFAFETVIHLK